MENTTNPTAPLTRRQAREIERRTGQRPTAAASVAGVSAPVIEASIAEIASAPVVHDTSRIERNELGALVSVLPVSTLAQASADENVETELAEVIDIPEAFTGRGVSIRAAKPAAVLARSRRRTAASIAAAASVAAAATAGIMVPAAVADGQSGVAAQADLAAVTVDAPAQTEAPLETAAPEATQEATTDLVAAPEVAVDRTETSVITLSSDTVAEVVTPEPTATTESTSSTTVSTGSNTGGQANTASTSSQGSSLNVDSSSVSSAALSYVGSYFGSCDLLTQAAYAAVGISLPRGVSAQAAMGTRTSSPQPGDLVVWPGEHIGIYAGNGMVIDDPGYGGRSVQHRSISWGNPYYVTLR